MSRPNKQNERRARGFARTSQLLQKQIREAGASRGFAVTRLLTHWQDIVGEEIAGTCRPVEVSYGREGFGATLSVLTTGAQAPMLEMQKEILREKVNACYGYAAISRIRITQTAPTGFAEGQARFTPAPSEAGKPDIAPGTREKAAESARDIADDGLRRALENLGQNVLSRRND